MIAVIWIIGWMFTVGLVLDPESHDKREGWIMPLAVPLWPLMLGITLREMLKQSGKAAQHEA